MMVVDGVSVPMPAELLASLPTAAAPSVRYVPVATARERLEAAGKWAALVAAVDLPTLMKICTLRDGLDAADPAVRAVLAAIGADPDVILAP